MEAGEFDSRNAAAGEGCGVELVDCHSHTYLSGHGEGTVAQLVDEARKRGIKTLAITEHMVLPASVDPNCDFSIPESEVEGYLAQIHEADAAFDDIEVVAGFEADWRPGCEDFIIEHTCGVPVLLGSVHMLGDGWCFDDPAYIDGWNERGVDDVWGEYFDLWMEACASKVPFTTMSHPDLPKKFGFMPTPAFALKSTYKEAAALAAEKGRMVEVNTSGWTRDVAEQFPSVDFLREFRLAGVDCTVGADAHTPGRVGDRIADAYEVMRQAGYDRVAVPTSDGGRRYIGL